MGLAVTTCPGLTFCPPSTMTRSPSFKPFATVILLPWAWPTSTRRGSTFFSDPTTRTKGPA